MAYVNFHMHTLFCDGKSVAEDYVTIAIAKGMKSVGFTAHMPIPIESSWSMKYENTNKYFDEIDRLRSKYSDKLEIYAGIEMDFLETDDRIFIKGIADRIDFRIGSVHYLYDEKSSKYYSTDGNKDDLRETFNVIGDGDNKKCVNAYYQQLISILREQKFDVLGHLDVIKKNNKDGVYFCEEDQWYKRIIGEVLDEVVNAGVIVEVNTGGMLRGYIKETYPGVWTIKECFKRHIPIILNSDAHCAENIDGYFEETAKLLRSLGYKQQRVLIGGKWCDIELPSGTI